MRCDGARPDSASPQPVTARAGLVTADGDIAPRSQHRCHLWPRRSSLRDDDRPGGFSRPGGRARGGCRASGPIRRFTRASPTRAGRVDVTSGCDPRRQRRLRPARCRRRGQGQYLGACARWRGRRSRCSSAPPSHCAWPPGPPVQAVHCHTRAGRSAVLARWRLRFAQQALSALCG